MEETTGKEGRGTFKLHLMYIIALWLVVVTILVGLAFTSRQTAQTVLEQQQEQMQRVLNCLSYADTLEAYSTDLSTLIARFAATGDVALGESYLELYSTDVLQVPRSEILEQFGFEGQSLHDIQTALSQGNDLLRQELWCLASLYSAWDIPIPPILEDGHESSAQRSTPSELEESIAKDYLFGEDYAALKSAEQTTLRALQQHLTQEIEAGQANRAKQTSTTIHRQMTLDLLIIVWLLLLLLVINRLLIRPVLQYSRRLSGQSAESGDYAPLDLQGSHELKTLGLAFNHVLVQLQEAKECLVLQNQELTVLSNTDYLTKVLNRLAMENYTSHLVEEYRGSDSPIGSIMLDLDHFKMFNDSFGHPAGDEALRVVATVLSELTDRMGGLVARMGGEEFFILLPGVAEEELDQFADEVLLAIRQAKISVSAQESRTLTISMGSFVYHGGNETLKVIYSCADKALYSAKRQGRNCHVSYASLQRRGKVSSLNQEAAE